MERHRRLFPMEQRANFWTYLGAVILFVVGLEIGINFPDLDQRLPYLLHRSLLTHGVLVPLLAFAIFRKQEHAESRLFAIGFCLASTVHLSFDLFPNAWRGFALIWIPFYGRTTALFSWLWIGLGCLLCLYFGLLLIKHALEILLSALGLVVSFVLNCATERVGLALLFLLVSVGVALLLPSRAAAMLRTLSRN